MTTDLEAQNRRIVEGMRRHAELPEPPATETVDLGDLKVGDRILRPNFGYVVEVASIKPRTPRARRFITVTYVDGDSWTGPRDFRIERLLP